MRGRPLPDIVPFVLFLSIGACSEGSEPMDGAALDGGASDDASFPDSGSVIGAPDAGRVDSGPRDVGFSDPATLLMGIEEIDGLRTYVHLMGTATSTLPPVIFLHTGPHLAHEYLPDQMRFLLPGRLLLYYDMRATGRSSFGPTGTSTLTAARHALDVHSIVEWLDQRADAATVDLLGHGYGAGIAALYAAAHPERVGRLVLTTPYPATAAQLADFNAEAQSRLTTIERSLINVLVMEPECRGNESMCTIEIWTIAGPHYLCEENEERFRDLTFMYGSFRAKEFIEFDLRNNVYDWRPIFATIRAPTTVISGRCDPTPTETALTYTSSIAGAVHHPLQQSGHFPMVEERDEYQRLVRAALRR